LLLVRQDELM